MKSLLFFLTVVSCGYAQGLEQSVLPSSKMFSLSSEEMVFASKLSDANRRRFCYTFSVKERMLAMQNTEATLSADQKVDQVFASLYVQLDPKIQAR